MYSTKSVNDRLGAPFPSYFPETSKATRLASLPSTPDSPLTVP